MSVRLSPNVLVPCWIAAFGCLSLSAPPLGAAGSLVWLVVGVGVVPAVLMAVLSVGRRPLSARMQRRG